VEKLTSKQKIFVKEYAIDRNATRAAIAAGYSKNGAKVAGHRLLTNTNVRPKLDAQTTELLDNLGVKASYVLGGIVETIERCKQSSPVLDRKANRSWLKRRPKKLRPRRAQRL
jgi:phage terminase small subunit